MLPQSVKSHQRRQKAEIAHREDRKIRPLAGAFLLCHIFIGNQAGHGGDQRPQSPQVHAHQKPTIINTFLESYDFSGKTIILFATSGGSGFGKTVDRLKGSCPGAAALKEGRILNGKLSKEELAQWVKSLGL